MDFLSAMRISGTGLAAQRTRMNSISSNIANAEVTRTPEGGPYRPKEVVFGSEPDREPFGVVLDGELQNAAQQVHAIEVNSSNRPPKLVYNPHHPDAGPDGMVAMPDINVMKEMADMIQATRSYEANVTALNAAKQMALKALSIGK